MLSHISPPQSEAALLQGAISAILALDPDILLGWDVQKESYGYLTERASVLGVTFLRAISKTPEIISIKEKQVGQWVRSQDRPHPSSVHSLVCLLELCLVRPPQVDSEA